MSAAVQTTGQLELLPDREDWQVELRRAFTDLRLVPRRMSFDDAMAHPVFARCIRNIAHARRQKGARR